MTLHTRKLGGCEVKSDCFYWFLVKSSGIHETKYCKKVVLKYQNTRVTIQQYFIVAKCSLKLKVSKYHCGVIQNITVEFATLHPVYLATLHQNLQ